MLATNGACAPPLNTRSLDPSLDPLMSQPSTTSAASIQGPSPLVRASRAAPRAWLFLAALLAFYFTGLLALKWWLYPGWTWRGYITDLKALFGLSTIAVPLAVLLWRAVKRQKPDESFVDSIGHLLTSSIYGHVITVISALTVCGGIAVVLLGEAMFSEDFLRYSREHNWTHARRTLQQLQKQPLRPDLLQACALFVDVHEKSESNLLTESVSLRERRDALNNLAANYSDPYHLIDQSYAEIGKALFFVEDDPNFLVEAMRVLLKRLVTEPSASYRSLILSKLGELELAGRDYAGAQAYFEEALSYDSEPLNVAAIRANLGNALASQQRIAQAIEQYTLAERSYPEGRRHIFYSNFGYLLMMADTHAEAEEKVKRALKIKPDDWYSYLNLGLVYDALKRHSDAQHAFSTVIANVKHPDSTREARIFLGRSIELGGTELASFAPIYLEALGRASLPADVAKLSQSPESLSEMYDALAQGLLQTNTHGTERYVRWFRDRAAAALKPNHSGS